MNYELARKNMVDSQIRTNKVTDPLVISALRSVAREKFVPEGKKGVAYIDDDLNIGGDRFLMEPMVFARLVQLADIRRTDVVLDVGCASGYSSAVLAQVASSVVALESDAELVSGATETLHELGVDNAVVVQGELAHGLPTQGPYDVILINGQVDQVPDSLREQLSEGGRLVAVVRDKGIGRATVITRRGGAFGSRTDFDASVGALPGFVAETAFEF